MAHDDLINLIIISLLISTNFRQYSQAAVLEEVINNEINVVSGNYGARGDGRTDSSQAFVKAWEAACSSASPSTLIYVPKGQFLINSSLTFKGPCKNAINIHIQGTLFAPTDYRLLSSSSSSWILFIQVNRITLTGGGTLDARGAGFWDCRLSTSTSNSCPAGVRSLTFNWANDIVIDGLKSINSQLMHLVINSCNNVTVRNVQILAPEESPNTDGIHVQYSTGVTISTCTIRTGDDCISVGPNTRNLWMERIQCGPGHGVSIGSLARGGDYNEGGVQNVTLTNSVFTGSDNGLRIKTWARPSTAFVTNVNYRNIVMKNVQNPIIIDQDYCPNNNNNQACPPGRRRRHQRSSSSSSSGVKISDIRYENIKGSSASPVAVVFECSKSNPCVGIRLQDISLSYMNRPAQSSCLNTNLLPGSSLRVLSPNITNCLPPS